MPTSHAWRYGPVVTLLTRKPGSGSQPIFTTTAGRAKRPLTAAAHELGHVLSAPHAGQVRRRLEALDLLVVCDVVPSETAELADVVLPVTQWAEESGTMTTL